MTTGASTPPRSPRPRWQRILVKCVSYTALGGVILVGIVWWALRSHTLADVICKGYQKRLPGNLHIGSITLDSANRLSFLDVTLASVAGGEPLFTAPRISLSGALWKGKITNVEIVGSQLYLSAANARFLHAIILRESDHPATGLPTLRHLAISGQASIDGVLFATNVTTNLEQYGAAVTGGGTWQMDGQTVAVNIIAEGSGEALRHHFNFSARSQPLAAHAICRRLVDLQFVPAIPEAAYPWIPERIDPQGSHVYADRHWQHFTGNIHVAWPEGRLSTALTLNHQRMRLDRLLIAADACIGSLEGIFSAGFLERQIEINALHWRPGPKVPLPAVIPVDAILAAMPQAVFTAHLRDQWELSLRLAGGAGFQTALTWTPGQPLTVDGVKLPLTLIQPFMPSSIDLAAGRANRLHVVVGNRLESLHAEVEQTRALWNGWALGTVDATVDMRPMEDGYDFGVDLMNVQGDVRKSLGRVTWRGGATRGDFSVRADDIQALLTRIKGPIMIPELRGSVDTSAAVELRPEGLRGSIHHLAITGGVLGSINHDQTPGIGSSTIRELLRHLDVVAEGPFAINAGTLETTLSGRMTNGDFNLAERWIFLAKRKPVFTCQLRAASGTLDFKQVMLRATDARGAPLADGFSACLDASLTTTPFTTTTIGSIDHADLDLLASLLPQTENRLRGEGAITFTARTDQDGLHWKCWFLPLGATLDLGPSFRAIDLTGAVQFLIEAPILKR